MSDQEKRYTASVKRLPKSMVEVTVSVPAAVFDAARETALEEISGTVELPGFRKGKAPAKLIEQKVGEGAILEEMAERVIAKTYAMIIVGEKIDALGRPEVRITKIAMGNPLEFTLTTAVMPEVMLPDYLPVAAKVNAKRESPVASDDDLKQTIDRVRELAGRKQAEAAGTPFDPETPKPELTDEFVKTLGDYASVEDFTKKAREEIGKEKERVAAEKHRVAVIEAILEKTTIELPALIVEQELERMLDEYTHDIEKMGMKFDEYLKLVKKSPDDFRKDWHPDAEKRAKIQFIVAEIARKEHIEPKTEDLEREMNKLHILYPNAPLERLRGYVDMMLTNELVFKKLEEAE